METEDDGTITRILDDDHSYLKLLSLSGGDQTIIEAARMSTDKGFQGWGSGEIRCTHCGILHTGGPWETKETADIRTPCDAGQHDFRPDIGDERLLAYLWKHKHLTPFEMVQIRIEVQAPIFVFREWHRHRTQSYNELSARYTPLPDVNYIPTEERLLFVSRVVNRQAQGLGNKGLTGGDAAIFQTRLREAYATAQTTYECALNAGVPKELARLCLPVGRYSRMMASANLRNWLQFLELRMAPNAQYEIRMYAEALDELLHKFLPRTMKLFQADLDARAEASR